MKHMLRIEAIRDSSRVLDGNQLQPARTAATVRRERCAPRLAPMAGSRWRLAGRCVVGGESLGHQAKAEGVKTAGSQDSCRHRASRCSAAVQLASPNPRIA